MELDDHDIAEHHLVVRLGSALRLTWKEGGLDKSRLLLPGTVSFYPAGPISRCWWKQRSELLFLSIPRAFLTRMAGDDKPIELRACRGVQDRLVVEIARVLHNCARQNRSTELYAQTLVTALGAHLLHTRAAASPAQSKPRTLSPRQMNCLVDFIHAHLETQIDLWKLAEIAGLSPQYVGKLFKQTAGLSIHEYVARERIALARELLKDCTLSIGTIAHRLGFADQSHFGRVFRRLSGSSPARFRHEA